MGIAKVNNEENNMQPIKRGKGGMNPNAQKTRGKEAGKSKGIGESLNRQKNNRQMPGALGGGNVNMQSNNLQPSKAMGSGIKPSLNKQSNNRVKPGMAKGITRGNQNSQTMKGTIESVGSGQGGEDDSFSQIINK